VILLCVCYALGASAQPSSAQKRLGFSNLVFRPAGGDRVGLADEDFRVHILEELRRRGFNAVGAENLVFGSDHGQSAQLLLGGTVTELECQQASSPEKLDCRMGIEWQVLDVDTDKVVYKLLSRGLVVDVPREPVASLGKRLVFANLESLSKHPRFAKLLEAEATAARSSGYAKATLRSCRAGARAMPAASEQVLDATVVVQTSGGFGSGFVLGADGFVVTAAHVVPESSATVKLHDGREFPATVIRVDRRIDIALLRLSKPEALSLPCLPVRGTPVAVGSDVYAIGAPTSRDLSFSLARGIVSGVRLLQGVQYLQTDAAVNSGNSGGPLVTGAGEAAAIVSFKLVGASVEGVAFGVPLGPGLNALGVSLAEGFTSPELSSAGAAPPAARRKLVQDPSDPQPAFPSAAAARDTSVQGTGSRSTAPEVRRVLFGLGGTLAAAGIAFLVVHYAAQSTAPDAVDRSNKIRNWGIGGVVIGGAMIGVSIALP